MLLKELCEADGVSGNEKAVRDILLREVQKSADDIKIDTMGNLIVYKKGECSDKRIMMSAHMDEVGFIITGITDDGYLRFDTVGGIDTRVIISKKVRIGKERVAGVIGMKAIHLQKASERESVPAIKDLFIDIGADSKSAAENMVHIGDYAAFDTDYAEFGNACIKAKAIDDRAGCAVLLDTLNRKCKYDRYICFLVQEEVGLRGAQIAAHQIKPDIALVLESTTCSDVYGSKEHEYATKLGGGAAVSFMDRSSIVDSNYRKWLYDSAVAAKIPVQYKKTTMGGNDAGAIYISGEGVKTASLSVPCRYLHSPAGVAAKSDIDAMRRIVEIFIDRAEEVI